MLYPLKFKPFFLPKVWGSETWTLSDYGEYRSEVAEGILQGNTLSELVEIYMDELVGNSVFQQYGNKFPLLFKTIDAQDNLSIQVHPDDNYASRVQQSGKTEMWYVTHAQHGADIVMGFNRQTNAEEIASRLESDTIMDVLQLVPVHVGDVAFITPGCVHALRRGTQVAEIQQTSDMTYRLYDYQRPGLDGKLRPLHVKDSLAVLNYSHLEQPLVHYDNRLNMATNLVRDTYFTTNKLRFNTIIGRDYAALDSFVVYMCVEGQVTITAEEPDIQPVEMKAGETVLIPACINDIRLTPHKEEATILEIYIQ